MKAIILPRQARDQQMQSRGKGRLLQAKAKLAAQATLLASSREQAQASAAERKAERDAAEVAAVLDWPLFVTLCVGFSVSASVSASVSVSNLDSQLQLVLCVCVCVCCCVRGWRSYCIVSYRINDTGWRTRWVMTQASCLPTPLSCSTPTPTTPGSQVRREKRTLLARHLIRD